MKRRPAAKNDIANSEGADTDVSPADNGFPEQRRLPPLSVLEGTTAVAWKTIRALCVLSLLGLSIPDVLRSNSDPYKALTATYVT